MVVCVRKMGVAMERGRSAMAKRLDSMVGRPWFPRQPLIHLWKGETPSFPSKPALTRWQMFAVKLFWIAAPIWSARWVLVSTERQTGRQWSRGGTAVRLCLQRPVGHLACGQPSVWICSVTEWWEDWLVARREVAVSLCVLCSVLC